MKERHARTWKPLRHSLDPSLESVEVQESDPAADPSSTDGQGEFEQATDPEGTKGEFAEIESGRDLSDPLVSPREPGTEQAILVLHPSVATTRLIRESLENFTDARVDVALHPVQAFQAAMRTRYRLLFLPLEMEELAGPLLYEMIAAAYSAGQGPGKLAGGVVFIRDEGQRALSADLQRDVRVKGTLAKPIRIDRLLGFVEGLFDVRDPTKPLTANEA
ncbi:MAG: hypothetical protein AAF236_09265 [Verrucomicrobiota bacterium]